MKLSSMVKTLFESCMKALGNVFLIRGLRPMIGESIEENKGGQSSYVCESGVCYESKITV